MRGKVRWAHATLRPAQEELLPGARPTDHRQHYQEGALVSYSNLYHKKNQRMDV